MLAEPQCSVRRCKHLQDVIQPNGDESLELCTCAAYPAGIPDDIAYGDDLHLTPRPDQDNDIVYEKEG